ncbi:MAG: cytochrome c biogenesis heme-transporting ATPase CcmA [Gammaproteobacteria bacterium]
MKLILDHISFERDNHLLFSNIHCVLQAGDIVQIRGANGCGKSTLLRIVAGFIEPSSGALWWQNKLISQQKDQYWQQLCFVGHQNGIKPYLTVRENLLLNSALLHQPLPKHKLDSVLDRVGLLPLKKMQTQQLSAGQARRLALARLLISPARLWILDEPTTALDALGQALLVDLLNQHVANGGMIIVATHHDLPLETTINTIQLDTKQLAPQKIARPNQLVGELHA